MKHFMRGLVSLGFLALSATAGYAAYLAATNPTTAGSAAGLGFGFLCLVFAGGAAALNIFLD